MKSKHFKSEQELLNFTNDWIEAHDIVSIVKDHTNGDWIIFYLEF